MEAEKKKKKTHHLQNAFPGEVGQAATDWERVGSHPKDVTKEGKELSSQRPELKTF